LLEPPQVGRGVERLAVEQEIAEFAAEGGGERGALGAEAVEQVEAGLGGVGAKQRAGVDGAGAVAGEVFEDGGLRFAGVELGESVEYLTAGGRGGFRARIGIVVSGAEAEAAVRVGEDPLVVMEDFTRWFEVPAAAEQGLPFGGLERQLPEPGIGREGGPFAKDDAAKDLPGVAPAGFDPLKCVMIEVADLKLPAPLIAGAEDIEHGGEIDPGTAGYPEAAVGVVVARALCARSLERLEHAGVARVAQSSAGPLGVIGIEAKAGDFDGVVEGAARFPLEGLVERACFGGEFIDPPGLCHPAARHRVDDAGGDIGRAGPRRIAHQNERLTPRFQTAREHTAGESGTADEKGVVCCGWWTDHGILLKWC
jgi:hypothetical protein